MPVKSLVGEQWKLIDGTEKTYVSNLGRIKKGTKLKTIFHDHSGYKYVCEKDKKLFVHVCVAKAFVPNPYNNPVIDHLDGNKDNCKADNLEWVTVRENTQRFYGLIAEKGEKVTRRKTNILAIDKEDNATLYDNQSAAARALGVDVKSISKAVTGLIKTFKGFKFYRIETLTDERTKQDEQV